MNEQESSGAMESSSFDFEYWAELAATDRERFEHERKEAITKLISRSSPEMQEQLWRLQWRIDQVRTRASNPISACIQIQRMMLDSVLGPGGLHEALVGTPSKPLRKAKIIKLRR